METAAKWQESHSRKVTACWLRWLTLSVHLCVIPVGHYSCRNCNFTTITTNWFPQLAGRTFSFRFVSPVLLRAFRSTIMQQSCTHPPTNSPRGFFKMRGNRQEGGDFRLWHMHCKFIRGSQLCHMMSLTVLRFICTVKSGNCTYVCGVVGGGVQNGGHKSTGSSYISLHTWDINFCVKSVSGPPKNCLAREKFVMCIIYFFHTHELRIFYLIRDFLWSQPSIRLHSICIAIKLLASWILEKTIDSS